MRERAAFSYPGRAALFCVFARHLASVNSSGIYVTWRSQSLRKTVPAAF